MMKKKRDRITYKRNWRQVEKKRKWENSFIAEYTRLKFANIYHEAQCFYKALEQLYPNKDVKRTSEFVSWKKSLEQDSEPPIIVQHMYTTTHEEKVVENDTETQDSEVETGDTENQDSEVETGDTENQDSEVETSDTENQDSEDQSDDEESINGEEKVVENPISDNMVLNIPLENYLPTGSNPQPSYDYEVFGEERMQEIVEELRNDPELRNLFNPPENPAEDDEGVDLLDLEEEIELDFEPFDYRLEVELGDW